MVHVWDSDTSAYAVAVSSLCTVAIALAAAFFAARQVREARRTREAQAQPFVVVDIQPGKVWANCLTLVIENIGTTLARDVKITFDPSVTTTLSDSGLPGGALLQEGIAVLPPGRRIETLFDMSHDRQQEALPLRYEVTVEFADFRSKQMEPLRYVVDLGYLYDLEFIGEKTLHNVAESLDKIRREIERWRSSRGPGIAVWTRDTDRDIEAARWQYALTGKQRSLAHPSLREWASWPGRFALIRAVVITYREWRDKRSVRG